MKMRTEYYIIDSSKNITALVVTPTNRFNYKDICLNIMKIHSEVEQVGFVDFSNDRLRLEMSGGEFCGNATLSAVALFSKLSQKTGDFSINVSGSNSVIKAASEITGNDYFCNCFIPFPKRRDDLCVFEKGKEFILPVMELEGITHIIAPLDFNKQKAETLIKDYAARNKLSAVGFLFYGEENSSLIPLVYVIDIDTMFYENSCASGSCAICAYEFLKSNKNVSLLLSQPGGTISVAADKNYITLSNTIFIRGHFVKEM